MKKETVQSSSARSRLHVVVVIFVTTVLGVLGFKFLWMVDGFRFVVRSWSPDLQYLVHPSMRMVLVLIAWWLIRHVLRKDTDRSEQKPTMGLLIGWGRAWNGLVLGLVCSVPMLLLGMLSTEFTPSRYEIMYTAISPGLTEEIFYRAFLFGLLVQVVHWRMWTAAVVSGLIFGLAHIDITPDEGETILGQFGFWIGMIGLGGVMYAWLYARSGWNLWVVIALHAGMNLWWDMFDLIATPLGGLGATGARILCVGLAVLFVMHYRVLGVGRGSTIPA